nr:NADH dehydrogenase subunit 5 [Sarcoptes scabiei]AST11049.1 NADH dehydrogenase subunit 5 [Sarcoptes scabiei]AST11062.1 NADH dehydrogenase subunit 5 [Sarcoptes scabiei]AST11101.1 NADH dehydrogenase subunit 5 [Sarcoptes scabiei]AST11114.1 NADH dehydrogenase subunit 5 [Sarcoptes scabiei]
MFSSLFSILMLLLSMMSLYSSLFFITYGSMTVELFFPMISNNFSMMFMLDCVSMMFFFLVSTISSMIFLYSKFYMNMYKKEKYNEKTLMLTMLMFVLSMMILIFSYSWFMVMLGWDGLGMVSFLLVKFFNDKKTLDASMLTVLSNRIGDCLFIISFMMFFHNNEYSMMSLQKENSIIMLMFLTLGCFTKSAQMPFSAWLPAAMAAPTPVSSLVHSSTLVTAGVYLMIRFNFLLVNLSNLILTVSLTTMMLSGFYAVMEKDFKKIVAMSTLSQMSFMMFSIFSTTWILSFLHMSFHAIFKSMLFMTTGMLMTFVMGNQNSKYFSNFSMSFMSKMIFMSACLSLMGFPFSLGFYSKDMILMMNTEFMEMKKIIFNLSCMLTVWYSLRIMKLGFLNFTKNYSTKNSKEEGYFFIPSYMIFIISIFVGNIYMYMFLPPTNLFSLVEIQSGLIIILGGFLLFTLKKNMKKYFYLNMTMMSFMNFLLKKMNNKISKMNFDVMENTIKEELTMLPFFMMMKMKIMMKKMNMNLFLSFLLMLILYSWM